MWWFDTKRNDLLKLDLQYGVLQTQASGYICSTAYCTAESLQSDLQYGVLQSRVTPVPSPPRAVAPPCLLFFGPAVEFVEPVRALLQTRWRIESASAEPGVRRIAPVHTVKRSGDTFISWLKLASVNGRRARTGAAEAGGGGFDALATRSTCA